MADSRGLPPSSVLCGHHARRACRLLLDLPLRSERHSDLREELRLFPGCKMPAFVELVVVDEVGVRLLHPILRRVVELARKRARRSRGPEALRREEAELSLPVETGRGNRRGRTDLRSSVELDVGSGALFLRVSGTISG